MFQKHSSMKREYMHFPRLFLRGNDNHLNSLNILCVCVNISAVRIILAAHLAILIVSACLPLYNVPKSCIRSHKLEVCMSCNIGSRFLLSIYFDSKISNVIIRMMIRQTVSICSFQLSLLSIIMPKRFCFATFWINSFSKNTCIGNCINCFLLGKHLSFEERVFVGKQWLFPEDRICGCLMFGYMLTMKLPILVCKTRFPVTIWPAAG